MQLLPRSEVLQIGVLVYEDVDLLELALPLGILQSARCGTTHTVADTTDPVRAQTALTIVPDTTFDEVGDLDVIIIPGGRGAMNLLDDDLVLSWLHEQSVRARAMVGIGLGTAVLAEAGILTSGEAAAPRFALNRIRASAPDVEASSEATVRMAGRCLTARDGAAAAGATLELIRALRDEAEALSIADRMGFSWQPAESVFEGGLAPASRNEPGRTRTESDNNTPSTERTPDASSELGGSVAEGREHVSADASDGSEDWPNWRGPRGDGVSRETAWLDQGRFAWGVDLGRGHSCVAVKGKRVVAVGFDESESRDVIRCFDADSGLELWRFSYEAELNNRGHGGGSLSTPAIRDGRVFVTHRTGEMRALDLESGRLIWHARVAADYGLKGTEFGFSGSPLVLDNRVIACVGAVVALDVASGELVWKTRPLEAMYSTPAVLDMNGERRLLVFTKMGLFRLDSTDGSELDFYPWRKGNTTVNASTPVVVGEDRVFLSSGYGHGATMLAVDGEGFRPLWESRVMRTKLSGCVLYDDHLYGFDEATLKCITVDGDECWRKRGLGMGALMISGDRLLVLGRSGDLVIAEATSEGFHERWRENVLPRGTCWTSPVLSHGRIYCRNGQGRLVCMDHRSTSAVPSDPTTR